MHISQMHAIQGLIGSAPDADLVIMVDSRLISLILPIGIIQRVTVSIEQIRQIRRRHFLVLALRIPFRIIFLPVIHRGIVILPPLGSVHQVQFLRHFTDRDITVVRDLRFFVLDTSFRRNHDHAIRSTSTIDSRGGGILQYLQGFDLTRIQQIDIAYANHAIYHIQRLIR